MPLRAEYTLHHSDLGEFLSAPVWEEKNGSPLSVLSALTRLGIDPWAEGTRLAVLPRDAAASALAVILRRLPGPPLDPSEALTIAVRLVTLLPKGGSTTAIPGALSDGDAGQRRNPEALGRWILLALMVILVAWMLRWLWS